MIFTFGYAGKQVETLKEKIEALDALLIDIRYSPFSKDPQWRKNNLSAVFGQRYLLAGNYFGNVLYKSAGIKLSDAEGGLALIRKIDRNMILMCSCHNYERCHRKTVSEYLQSHGFKVKELEFTMTQKIALPQQGNEQLTF